MRILAREKAETFGVPSTSVFGVAGVSIFGVSTTCSCGGITVLFSVTTDSGIWFSAVTELSTFGFWF
ncbi:hypothetical protein J0383_18700 [Flavobacterium endoglycinae]|uniref:Uncharacterized protein n=1 Tax=Flavobacterium endoglycinae TaxID=2816357 RepID=A0ABX7QB67_9FLAO|nr:hypothetical protein [Flavobacterium endoglycinae]QSW88281.1 hypothetical protein J0383_18700 [Flavobacterium endoglycinae]